MAQSRQIKKLDELMDGALTERFNLEMERVLNNVFDQNTNPKASARSRSSLTSFRMIAAIVADAGGIHVTTASSDISVILTSMRDLPQEATALP